jgi:hypothetical protein
MPEIFAPAKIPRSARNDNGGNISDLQIIFLFFLQENNLQKALIPFIGVKKSSFPKNLQKPYTTSDAMLSFKHCIINPQVVDLLGAWPSGS